MHIGILAICFVPIGNAAPKPAPASPPPPVREFRGAWVATVANIDWPSKQGLSTAQQQAELVAILNKAAQLKLNAVILQVRPSCDALYASRIEPWSEYLTGKMGQPPEPFYDPLAFAIDQAHQRGLELHAWFNPFRARHTSAKSPEAPNHLSRAQPKWVRTYGNLLWLDPGLRAAQEHSTTVILDVVKRYDIDGVHLDDYFYPYKERDANRKIIDFPDEPTWTQYKSGGGQLGRSDWRRKNIDDFVQQLYRRIKSEKPWVKFGLSPFGIWRPGHPEQITGTDAYEDLYADTKKWLDAGWCDYFSPQLYWAIQPPEHSYSALLHWWAGQNSKRRHLWPGSSSATVGRGWLKEEILRQIRLTRSEPGVSGHVHWNMKSLMSNVGGLSDALGKEAYLQPALVPASTWLDNKPPGQAMVRFERIAKSDELRASWTAARGEPVWLWVLQFRIAGKWTTEILPAKQTSRSWPARGTSTAPDAVAISAVDRCGNMAAPVVVEPKSAATSRPSKSVPVADVDNDEGLDLIALISGWRPRDSVDASHPPGAM